MSRFVAALLIAISGATPVAAWNSLGHKVVADIAWRQIEPEKRQQIVDILRRHPRFDADFAGKMTDDELKGEKTVEDRWIFLHAATWPDIARGLKGAEQKKYDRPSWHYIDLPVFLDARDRQALGAKLPFNLSTDYPTRIDPNNYNVIQAIAYCRTTLASKAGPDVKALAYCWLFHLVGDIHQPLHAVSLVSVEHFPQGDRGGNEIKLVRGENLHSLWDNLLGRQYYLRNVDKAVAELSDRERFGDVWDSAATETDPRKWAEVSHTICENVVYDEAILTAVRNAVPGAKPPPIELPEEYYKSAGEHARRRIVAAGVRLVAILSDNSPRRGHVRER